MTFILAIAFSFMFAGVPFGWKALSMITSKFFLFLPIVGWIIYFLIKFSLSFLIGWVIAIPKLIILIKEYEAASRIEKVAKEKG